MLTKSSDSLVDKKSWIQQIVKDKSFIDIGGLWGTKNELVSCAISGGARRAIMADIAPQGHKLWLDLEEHYNKIGVSGYECLTTDITKESSRDRIGKVDVVHCSGIIYHVPDPFSMIMNLRAVTNEKLILSSMVVPAIISNGSREIDLGSSAALFVPGLSDGDREVVAAHLDSVDLKIAGINRPLDEEWVSKGINATYGPWWWLLTPSLLAKMLRAARFKVVDAGESWKGRAYSFLCEVE